MQQFENTSYCSIYMCNTPFRAGIVHSLTRDHYARGPRRRCERSLRKTSCKNRTKDLPVPESHAHEASLTPTLTKEETTNARRLMNRMTTSPSSPLTWLKARNSPLSANWVPHCNNICDIYSCHCNLGSRNFFYTCSRRRPHGGTYNRGARMGERRILVDV
jgi:hypothetical protein